ncbi:MAG: class I SAM-dependent methyltransferase [bacterium]
MQPQCNICGNRGKFLNPHLGKEGWHCANCSATSRHRLVMFILGRTLGLNDQPVYAWPTMKQIKILEPCPRGPQVVFLREKFDYFEPEFDAEKIRKNAEPRKYSDIQDLAFADESFDIVIASDVFEHVREDDKGFREIYRTLKNGGTFILTSPYDHKRAQTLIRVAVKGEDDIYLQDPTYAGGGGATLNYRVYGRDLLGKLNAVGFAVGYLETAIKRFKIHKYGIVICKKSPYLELTKYLSKENSDAASSVPLGFLLPNRLFLLYKFNLKSFLQFLREAKRKILK